MNIFITGQELKTQNLKVTSFCQEFKNEKWIIFDVLLDGSISEVATKKSDFKKIIKEEGVSGLVKNLRIRNQF